MALRDANFGTSWTGQTSVSYTHTTGAGLSNSCIDVTVHYFSTGTVSGVTYGGTALTKIEAGTLSASSDRTEIWRLLTPASGANTVQITFSASADGGAESLSSSGVNQTTPERNHGSSAGHVNAGANFAPSMSGAQSNDIAFEGAADSDRAQAIGMQAHSGRTQDLNNTGVSGEGAFNSDWSAGNIANPQTAQWNNNGATGVDWAHAWVIIADVGTVAAPIGELKEPMQNTPGLVVLTAVTNAANS